MKKKIKLKMKLWITIIFGASLAYFVWLSWNKLTDYLGDSNIVWIITGVIVLLGIVLGQLSINKIIDGFTQ